MFCNKCGAEVEQNTSFCTKCGTKIKQSSKKEQKNKKEMSKGMRIFVIVLLSIIILYFLMLVIANLNETQQRISEGNTNFYIGIGIWLIIVFLCGCGIIKNISKLRRKELTAEQLQKRKKRNTILGLSSVVAVVLVIVVMFGYGNISKSNEKEQMISKIKEYQANGYLDWSEENYLELETYSNDKIKEILDRIEANKKLLDEYDKKYSAKLDEIFAKEIQVELYPHDDNYYMYIVKEKYAKGQVEYVTISGDNIYEIYYSVEMNLAVTNKYDGSVSRGLVKKYYKIPYLRDIDKTQEINNYNDQAIIDEINNAIDGKTVIVKPSTESKNYKYDFKNINEDI